MTKQMIIFILKCDLLSVLKQIKFNLTFFVAITKWVNQDKERNRAITGRFSHKQLVTERRFFQILPISVIDPHRITSLHLPERKVLCHYLNLLHVLLPPPFDWPVLSIHLDQSTEKNINTKLSFLNYISQITFWKIQKKYYILSRHRNFSFLCGKITVS